MKKILLPQARSGFRYFASVARGPVLAHPILPQGVNFDVAPGVLARWNASIVAKDEKKQEEDDNSISVYDVIGFDPWTGGGVTAKRIAAALRSIGKRNVVVNINSPGGDLFEGIAIYNLLRDHEGEVTVRVVGLAASAASVIAMAGDNVQVARAGFMMVHNVWVMAIGNRNDLRDAADQLETFDDALAGVYAARTGMDKAKIAKMMDKETWFSGDQAIESGFADELLPADQVEETGNQKSAQASLRDIDVALARTGMSRAERRQMINRIKELGGTPNAAAQEEVATQDAGHEMTATQDAGAEVKRLVDSFTSSLQA